MRTPHLQGSLTIHRPWLGVWREEIQQYAKDHQLVWQEDPTNLHTHHQRNHLRHVVLPLLEKSAAPGLRQRLWQTAETLQVQGSWLESLIDPTALPAKLALRTLRQFHPGHQRALLMAWFKHQGVENISYQDIVAAQGLLDRPQPARINLSRGRYLRRQKGWLFIE
jgi:tRNA(Ile)-lysidine synthase